MIVTRGLGKSTNPGSLVMSGLGGRFQVIVELVDTVAGAGLWNYKPNNASRFNAVKITVKYKGKEWKDTYRVPRRLTYLTVEAYRNTKESMLQIKSWFVKKPLVQDTTVKAEYKRK